VTTHLSNLGLDLHPSILHPTCAWSLYNRINISPFQVEKQVKEYWSGALTPFELAFILLEEYAVWEPRAFVGVRAFITPFTDAAWHNV
jgi:hypothetical protein